MRLRQHTHGVVLLRFADHEHQAPEALCAAGGGRRRSGFVHVEVLNPTHPLDVEPLQALVWSMERRLMRLAGIHGELARRMESFCGDQTAGNSCTEEVGKV
jgi:hypothetical protein